MENEDENTIRSGYEYGTHDELPEYVKEYPFSYTKPVHECGYFSKRSFSLITIFRRLFKSKNDKTSNGPTVKQLLQEQQQLLQKRQELLSRLSQNPLYLSALSSVPIDLQLKLSEFPVMPLNHLVSPFGIV
jgi:hypothetical protein